MSAEATRVKDERVKEQEKKNQIGTIPVHPIAAGPLYHPVVRCSPLLAPNKKKN
jgi:hypothetical protein